MKGSSLVYFFNFPPGSTPPHHHPIDHYSTYPPPTTLKISILFILHQDKLFFVFCFFQYKMIFCIDHRYTLDFSNYFILKLLLQGGGSSKLGYYYYDYFACVSVFFVFIPNTCTRTHTSIHIIWDRGYHYIQHSECSFLHLLLLPFRLNLLFFMFFIFYT